MGLTGLERIVSASSTGLCRSLTPLDRLRRLTHGALGRVLRKKDPDLPVRSGQPDTVLGPLRNQKARIRMIPSNKVWRDLAPNRIKVTVPAIHVTISRHVGAKVIQPSKRTITSQLNQVQKWYSHQD